MPKKNKTLRVCMLIDAWFPFIGGGQVHVYHLRKNLEATGQVEISLFHSPHHHLLIRLLWNLWVIPQVIIAHQKSQFDLIHAHAFSAGISAKLISLVLNLPLVFTVHGSHLMDAKKVSLKAWLERVILTQIRYSHQISVTKSFTNYPNVNKRISVIRNGVDIKAFERVKTKKNQAFTFLYVGRDHPTKGLDLLVSVWSQIKKLYPQLKLRLITGGKTGKSLIREYKQAHVFILPSLVEGQPIALLEAWAAKLPVIATKTSGVKEIATDGIDSLLIAPGSALQLKQAITKIYLMKPKTRQKLGKAGFNQIKNQYTWDKIASQTLKVYRKVL